MASLMRAAPEGPTGMDTGGGGGGFQRRQGHGGGHGHPQRGFNSIHQPPQQPQQPPGEQVDREKVNEIEDVGMTEATVKSNWML